jgi:YebC/PmpR family DNA-binding regulatory protein
MPNDSIARALKKASGENDLSNFEEIEYEGYGPGGVAVIVEAMTDNRNRTAGEVRHLFDKFGGNLGTSGCVSFMFEKKGQIIIEKSDSFKEDEIMMISIDAGAEDFISENEYYEIITVPENFSQVREALENNGYEFATAEVTRIPSTYTGLTEVKQIEFMQKLIDNLEDLDDVGTVYHNWEG